MFSDAVYMSCLSITYTESLLGTALSVHSVDQLCDVARCLRVHKGGRLCLFCHSCEVMVGVFGNIFNVFLCMAWPCVRLLVLSNICHKDTWWSLFHGLPNLDPFGITVGLVGIHDALLQPYSKWVGVWPIHLSSVRGHIDPGTWSCWHGRYGIMELVHHSALTSWTVSYTHLTLPTNREV